MKTYFHLWQYLAQFLLQREMFQTEVAEKIENIFCVQQHFFLPEIHAVCEIMWKNSAKPDRPHITIWPCAFSCWIPKAIDAHLECVILIVFPLQQWLHQSASMLLYTYTDCLVSCWMRCCFSSKLSPHQY